MTWGALTDLASSVGPRYFLIPMVGVTIVNAVGAKIIEMQAEKDIRKAVNKAAEAVDIMAPVLEQNFADLRKIHDAASTACAGVARLGAVVLSTELLRVVDGRTAAARVPADADQRLPVRASSPAVARSVWTDTQKEPELAKKLRASIPQEQADQLKALKDSDSTFDGLDLAGKDVAATVEARQGHLLKLLRRCNGRKRSRRRAGVPAVSGRCERRPRRPGDGRSRAGQSR